MKGKNFTVTLIAQHCVLLFYFDFYFVVILSISVYLCCCPVGHLVAFTQKASEFHLLVFNSLWRKSESASASLQPDLLASDTRSTLFSVYVDNIWKQVAC